MTRIEVTLSTGQVVAANIPREIRVDPPSSDEAVRDALAVAFADAVRPHIHRRPTIQQVVRDSHGRITGMREFEGDPPRTTLARQAGEMLAELVIPVDAGAAEPTDGGEAQ